MVDLLFEVSSEAGNKVGGIYTVLQSKSSEMVKAFGNSYHLIGFYDESSAKTELEQLKEAFAAMNPDYYVSECGIGN